MTVDFGSSAKSKILTVSNGTSVFDALNVSFSVEHKEFVGMGKMIIGIDSVTQNSTHYWLYFVDGRIAGVAADKFILTKDSSVELKFLRSDIALSYFK